MRPLVGLLGSIACLLVACAAPAAALSGPELDAAAGRLEHAVIAPCCFQQTVADHRSPQSDALRNDIRRRLRAGDSEAAILAAYEREYGERILAAPHTAGFGLLAWLTPVVALGLAGLAVWRWLRRHEARPRAAAGPQPASSPPVDPALAARLDAELARLD